MQNTLAKLLGAWCVLLLLLPVAYLWLKPGIIPGQGAEVLLKLFVLLAVAGATGLSFTYAVSKRWAQRTALLENFVDSLPDTREAHFADSAETAQVRELLEYQLSERERLIVTLYFYEELTLAEIAEVVSESESAVSRALKGAIDRLRAAMKVHKEDSP